MMNKQLIKLNRSIYSYAHIYLTPLCCHIYSFYIHSAFPKFIPSGYLDNRSQTFTLIHLLPFSHKYDLELHLITCIYTDAQMSMTLHTHPLKVI